MSSQRHMVRMAEKAVSADAGDLLVSLGLGSCIGLALIDADARVAGLVHIVLPQAPPALNGAPPWKFADTAAPALLDELVRSGARPDRLRAVLAGGAQMFGGGGASPVMQIGARNAESTLAALEVLGVAVRACETGGSSGRSIEVIVATGEVSVRGVGQPPKVL
jgi:chemotaxis protein CheD